MGLILWENIYDEKSNLRKSAAQHYRKTQNFLTRSRAPLLERVKYSLFLNGLTNVIKADDELTEKIGKAFAVSNVLDDALDNKDNELLRRVISYSRTYLPEYLQFIDTLVTWKSKLKFDKIEDFIKWDLLETYGFFTTVTKDISISRELDISFRAASVYINIIDDILDVHIDSVNSQPNILLFLLSKYNEPVSFSKNSLKLPFQKNSLNVFAPKSTKKIKELLNEIKPIITENHLKVLIMYYDIQLKLLSI